ncbi:MAG: formylglycine-generating enzyme family protein [Motiliproteus sp.]|nr:formylglycine-generating enzyme family protein [Motiliproteus sp.]MCW9052937.1 formylglycine-generating enzyme family protein [Motiliproteus sp.]
MPELYPRCMNFVLICLAIWSPISPAENTRTFQDHLLSGGVCHHCPELVMLPKGRFFMGAFPWEGHDDERGPENRPFRVNLNHQISLSVSEITLSQYQAFIDANPTTSESSRCSGVVEGDFKARIDQGWLAPGFAQNQDHPVVCVNWFQANAYADWLSRITGQRYRLPTEAEWEYAARAGSLTRYWWGDRIGSGYANCLQPVCGEKYSATAPGMSMKPNGFGLHHMLGNVWEWVADCYQSRAYLQHTRQYPKAVKGPDNCKRVIRGGSWTEGGWSLRAANREGWLSQRALNDIGFRVVREGAEQPL